MKSILYTVVLLSLFLSSCVLDNYDAPDAQFYGSVIDEDKNQPIQQDVWDGSRIDFVELGFANPNTRQIRFHSDGTFRENNLFSGSYQIQALRGNFFPTEKEIIDIKGKTEYIFRARPYIRIQDMELAFDEIDGIVTAVFTLDQVSENKVASVQLIADRNPNLSNSIWSARTSQTVNAVVSKNRKFQMRLSTENMESGKEYYFRAGALISDIGEAKHNYSAPVRLLIDNSKVIPDVVIPGNVLDACASLDGWFVSGGDYFMTLEPDGRRPGIPCISVQGTWGWEDVSYFLIQKNFAPFDAKVTKENGFLAFDLFVSDAERMANNRTQFQITSFGGPDKNYFWMSGDEFAADQNLTDGWNKIEVDLSVAREHPDGCNLSAITYIRFLFVVGRGPFTAKISNIRFYTK